MIIGETGAKDDSFISSNRSLNSSLQNSNQIMMIKNEYRRSRKLSRYNNALKNLIPIRLVKTSDEEMPIDKAGFFSTISNSWISKYLWISYRKGITLADLPKPSPFDTANHNAKRLESLWNDEVIQHSLTGASFSRAAWKFIRTRILVAAFMFSCSITLGFFGPALVMRRLLEHVESPEKSISTGIMWVFFLMVADILRILFFNWGWNTCYRTGLRMKSAFITIMYKKLIKTNNPNNRNSGKLINMMANDGQSAYDLCVYTPMMGAGLIVTILILIYIVLVLSPMALVGFLFFFLFYPLQYLISRLNGYFKKKSIQLSDKRVSIINEMLMCIKLIKMYAWEDPFSINLLELRKKERAWLEKMCITRSYGSSLTSTLPIIAGIITFSLHVAGGYGLTAAQAFPIITIFINQMKNCLSAYREGPRQIIETNISFKRMKVFPILLLLNSQARHMISFFEVAITSIINARLSFTRIKNFIVMSYQQSFIHFIASDVKINGFIKILIYYSYACMTGDLYISVLSMEESNCVIQKPIVKSQALSIMNGSFVCDFDSSDLKIDIDYKRSKSKDKNQDLEKNEIESLIPKRIEILSDINLEISKSKLIGICGHVGCGKTSLLKAALGQLRISTGKVFRDGTCAYVSQQAWILNTTFKENILFGNKFDAQRYYAAIVLCCLQDDLDSLPAADETEIGERGINLSGGQKQRVALARAYYANQDIYFLDDPLSAVDANVGWYIFENLIQNALKDKTIILVTHQIPYLSRCDQIYMMSNGRIVEQGDHMLLIQAGKEYASMVKNISANYSLNNHEEIFNRISNDYSDDDDDIGELIVSENNQTDNNEQLEENEKIADGKLITPEKMEEGTIKLHTYLLYISSMGGFFIAAVVLINVLLNTSCVLFSNWWLAHWIKAGSGGTTILVGNETFISDNILDNPDLGYYQSVYAACIFAIIGSSILRGFALTHVALSASSTLHNKLFKIILNTTMQFFETTPKGRIQNIFSRDISDLDGSLPLTLEVVLHNVFHGIMNVLIICVLFPYLIIPFAILSVLFYFLSKIFRKTLRDLQRHESTSRSPIFSFATTTLQGLDTIHAFKKEKDFVGRFYGFIDVNGTCDFMSNVLIRWAAVRFDVLTIIAYICTGLVIVFLKNDVSPAMAGLALSFCGQMTGFLQYTIRVLSQTELKFISVEKIGFYLRTLKNEDDYTKPALVIPNNDWPNNGIIEFKNVSLKYRPNTPIILNDISFRVNSGEKLGIVGRTGSGKSSLITALFRLVEISKGSIEIDDINISSIHLKKLRDKLCIIPQDPMIFSGTIRYNLDPWKIKTDEELWAALEKTKLKNKVISMPGQLDAIVDSSGSNLSIGECQLFCLARALLRKNKILILDEATASVDPQTEAVVQTTIQETFSDCTVLIIAHRLQNVLSCDRILVMKAGKIAEIDTPAELLENKNSEFSKMMIASENNPNAY